jgi:hypothetical protein
MLYSPNLFVLANSQKPPLSCRVHISLQGMEWFIYNRTSSYDTIVAAMDSNVGHSTEGTHIRVSGEGIGSLRKIFSWTSVVPECMFMNSPLIVYSY